MSVKEQYWKYSLITIILGLGLILFIKMSPFMGGILGACTIYIMVRKQMFYLTQEKHFKKSITAILLLIEAIMCFLVPLSLAVWLLINKLQTVNVDTTGFIHTVTNLADWLHTKTGYDLLSTENISSIASILPAIGQFLMGSISSFAVNAFVLVFILYFMLIGGIQMEKYIYELLPFSDTNKKNVLKEIRFILQKKMADTHPLITIFGVVIGLSLFGFMGVIFGPLLLSIFILCVNIFKTQYLK